MQLEVREHFLDMMDQFLGALAEVFAECMAIQGYKTLFTFRITQNSRAGERQKHGTELVIKWHQQMSPYYAMVRNRDERIILADDLEILQAVRIAEKWTPDLHPETKNAIWEYLTKLNELAHMHNMYQTVPTNMLGSIEGLAANLAAKVESGEMALSDLNFATLSQQVMQNIKPEDLQQFAEQIQANGGAEAQLQNMGQMYTSMTAMLTGGAGDVMGNGNGNGLLQMMGGLLGRNNK